VAALRNVTQRRVSRKVLSLQTPPRLPNAAVAVGKSTSLSVHIAGGSFGSMELSSTYDRAVALHFHNTHLYLPQTHHTPPTIR
jgi:hypothetical protein